MTSEFIEPAEAIPLRLADFLSHDEIIYFNTYFPTKDDEKALKVISNLDNQENRIVYLVLSMLGRSGSKSLIENPQHRVLLSLIEERKVNLSFLLEATIADKLALSVVVQLLGKSSLCRDYPQVAAIFKEFGSLSVIQRAQTYSLFLEETSDVSPILANEPGVSAYWNEDILYAYVGYPRESSPERIRELLESPKEVRCNHDFDEGNLTEFSSLLLQSKSKSLSGHAGIWNLFNNSSPDNWHDVWAKSFGKLDFASQLGAILHALDNIPESIGFLPNTFMVHLQALKDQVDDVNPTIIGAWWNNLCSSRASTLIEYIQGNEILAKVLALETLKNVLVPMVVESTLPVLIPVIPRHQLKLIELLFKSYQPIDESDDMRFSSVVLKLRSQYPTEFRLTVIGVQDINENPEFWRLIFGDTLLSEDLRNVTRQLVSIYKLVSKEYSDNQTFQMIPWAFPNFIKFNNPGSDAALFPTNVGPRVILASAKELTKLCRAFAQKKNFGSDLDLWFFLATIFDNEADDLWLEFPEMDTRSWTLKLWAQSIKDDPTTHPGQRFLRKLLTQDKWKSFFLEDIVNSQAWWPPVLYSQDFLRDLWDNIFRQDGLKYNTWFLFERFMNKLGITKDIFSDIATCIADKTLQVSSDQGLQLFFRYLNNPPDHLKGLQPRTMSLCPPNRDELFWVTLAGVLHRRGISKAINSDLQFVLENLIKIRLDQIKKLHHLNANPSWPEIPWVHEFCRWLVYIGSDLNGWPKTLTPLLLGYHDQKVIGVNPDLTPMAGTRSGIIPELINMVLNHNWQEKTGRDLRKTWASHLHESIQLKDKNCQSQPVSDEERKEPNWLWRYAYVRALGDLGVKRGENNRYFLPALEKLSETECNEKVSLAAKKVLQGWDNQKKDFSEGSDKRLLFQAWWWFRQAKILSLGGVLDEAAALETRTKEFRTNFTGFL